jgi:hypothetical protein
MAGQGRCVWRAGQPERGRQLLSAALERTERSLGGATPLVLARLLDGVAR